MPNTKPFVVVATMCEKVLLEADGVTSAIRIVDTFSVEPIANASPDARPVIQLSGLVALKSGDLVGNFTVAVVFENADGERTAVSPAGGWPVRFNGGEHGVQIKLDFRVEINRLGLVWFDVLFEDELLTRIPVRLRAADTTPAEAQSS